jgi:hypothetical protein
VLETKVEDRGLPPLLLPERSHHEASELFLDGGGDPVDCRLNARLDRRIPNQFDEPADEGTHVLRDDRELVQSCRGVTCQIDSERQEAGTRFVCRDYPGRFHKRDEATER